MVKTLDDYIDRLVELFPEVPKKEIVNIVTRGLKEMSLFCLEGIDYAVDYKEPGASYMIASNTMNSRRSFKANRRDCFLKARRETKALMDELGLSYTAANMEKKRRKKCQEENMLLETQNET